MDLGYQEGINSFVNTFPDADYEVITSNQDFNYDDSTLTPPDTIDTMQVITINNNPTDAKIYLKIYGTDSSKYSLAIDEQVPSEDEYELVAIGSKDTTDRCPNDQLMSLQI